MFPLVVRMDERLLHDLMDDKSIWQLFSRALNARHINVQIIPFYKNYVHFF